MSVINCCCSSVGACLTRFLTKVSVTGSTQAAAIRDFTCSRSWVRIPVRVKRKLGLSMFSGATWKLISLEDQTSDGKVRFELNQNQTEL